MARFRFSKQSENCYYQARGQVLQLMYNDADAMSVNLKKKFFVVEQMSWAANEWKDGLGPKAVQEVTKLEGQLERFRKDSQQKQFQLESLEQVLEKHKRKLEDEKSAQTSLKRENQGLQESCTSLDRVREKLEHELHNKEQQVC